MAQYTKYIAVLILLSLHTTSSVPMKTNSHPVIEVNEYSRIDENLRPPTLPYGNPLAGNSKQNARLHAQNQQAMFNAERLRQHRAQLQRWTKAPQQEDSYMKAYHESQENHQLDLEQKLRNSRHVTKLAFNRENVHMGVTKPISVIDNKHIAVTKAPVRTRVPIHQPKRGMEYGPDVIKITKEDAIIPEKNRPHRSYGSVHFKPIIQSKKFQTVVSLSAGPTYDQGVTIKPNGNNGFASQSNGIPQEPKLYTSITSAIPNEGQYVYPQYGQAHNYESANNIHTLNSLLNKPASEQLTEFNALINNDKNPATETKDPLTTPIDLYFYLKDSDPNSLTKYYEQSSYGEVAPTYASAYTNPVKDHIPITEEVDDIEDPNNNNRLKQYGLQSFTPTAEKLVETTTIKTNNYYKVEVASQTITAPVKKPAYYKKEEETKPTYEILQYASPTYGQELEESERYLHHKAQNAGIQNLNEDGIGVSAYADENLHYAANYEFGYRVRDYKTGNHFGHHEAKRGLETNGNYHVLLPDGRMQNVKYSAGPTGFHADISYDHAVL